MRKVFERYLKVTEEKQLLAHVGGLQDVLARRDHAWMRFLRHTGVRVQAFSRLYAWDARQALKTHHLELPATIQKQAQAHRIYCSTEARKALRELLRIRCEMGYPDIPDMPLVLSRNHRRMSVRSYQARMRHWCRAAGLDVEASPHWFRHTLAKRLIMQSTARDPLGVVQAVLGHSSRTSTGIYTLPDRDDIEQALEEAV